MSALLHWKIAPRARLQWASPNPFYDITVNAKTKQRMVVLRAINRSDDVATIEVVRDTDFAAEVKCPETMTWAWLDTDGKIVGDVETWHEFERLPV